MTEPGTIETCLSVDYRRLKVAGLDLGLPPMPDGNGVESYCDKPMADRSDMGGNLAIIDLDALTRAVL